MQSQLKDVHKAVLAHARTLDVAPEERGAIVAGAMAMAVLNAALGIKGAEFASPAFVLRPKLEPWPKDGWCAYYGEEPPDKRGGQYAGVAGYGGSPQEAFEDFNIEWYKKGNTS